MFLDLVVLVLMDSIMPQLSQTLHLTDQPNRRMAYRLLLLHHLRLLSKSA